MCEYCSAGPSTPAASSSKDLSVPAASADQETASNEDETMQEVERELKIEDGMEEITSGVGSPASWEGSRGGSGKRGLAEDVDGWATGRLLKRARTEGSHGQTLVPADLSVYIAISNLSTLIGDIERSTEEVVTTAALRYGKYETDMHALRSENEKLKRFTSEHSKRADDLERTLWKVRDEYYNLKATCAAQASALKEAQTKTDATTAEQDGLGKATQDADQQHELLRQNMQTLTKDYDELKKENEGLLAQNEGLRVQRDKHRTSAEEHARKAEEVTRVLWLVRGDYYSQKDAAKQAQSKVTELTSRVGELVQEVSQVLQAKADVANELALAKAECEKLKAREKDRAAEVVRLSKENSTLRDEHEQLKRAWTLSIVGTSG